MYSLADNDEINKMLQGNMKLVRIVMSLYLAVLQTYKLQQTGAVSFSRSRNIVFSF